MKKGFYVFLLLFTSFIASASGLSVTDLIDYALLHNFDMQKQQVQQDLAHIQLSEARAFRLPKVDFESSFTFIGNPMGPIRVKAGEFGIIETAAGPMLLPPEDTLLYKGMESTYYQFKLIVDQALYTWGKIPLGIELASQALLLQTLQAKQLEQDIHSRVPVYFLSLQYLQKMKEHIDTQAEHGERLVEISRNSYDSGFILFSDFLQAQIQVKEIERAKLGLEEKILEQLVALRNLTGNNSLDAEELDFSQDYDKLKTMVFPETAVLKSDILNNYAAIELLDSLIKLENTQLQLAEAEAVKWPDIGLRLELSYSGSRFPFIETDWYRQNTDNWTLSLGFRSTVYDAGAAKRSIATQERSQRQAQLNYETAVSQLLNTVDELLLKRDLARQNIDYYDLLDTNHKEQINIKTTQWQSGAGSEIDVLMEQIERETSRIQRLQHELEYIIYTLTIDQLRKPLSWTNS